LVSKILKQKGQKKISGIPAHFFFRCPSQFLAARLSFGGTLSISDWKVDRPAEGFVRLTRGDDNSKHVWYCGTVSKREEGGGERRVEGRRRVERRRRVEEGGGEERVGGKGEGFVRLTRGDDNSKHVWYCGTVSKREEGRGGERRVEGRGGRRVEGRREEGGGGRGRRLRETHPR
jgi:hypothetical protein